MMSFEALAFTDQTLKPRPRVSQRNEIVVAVFPYVDEPREILSGGIMIALLFVGSREVVVRENPGFLRLSTQFLPVRNITKPRLGRIKVAGNEGSVCLGAHEIRVGSKRIGHLELLACLEEITGRGGQLPPKKCNRRTVDCLRCSIPSWYLPENSESKPSDRWPIACCSSDPESINR
jgi:hypothetical protein